MPSAANRRPPLHALVLALAALLPWGHGARALEMLSGTVEGVGPVLLLRDCAREAPPCEEFEQRFHEGDAARLDRMLAGQRFNEVWLDSGGGDSAEGQQVGRVLRKHRMAVRVAKGSSCASACTVAFLGGVIRTVDEGGRYQVHARSGFLHGVKDELKRRLATAPDAELRRHALQQRDAGRQFVAERMIYIQTMIGGKPNEAGYAAWLGSEPDRLPAYLASPAYKRDVARINGEGDAAAQAIVMDIERGAVDEALEFARPYLAQLGPRAAAAHRMMEAMYATAIVRVAELSPEALLKLGFVTPILGR